MNVELYRIGRVSSGPQFGIVKVNTDFCCISLERPWLSNVKNVSCIPVGNYTCVRTHGRKTNGGMEIPITYEVMDVPNRSGILFHVGNYVDDTQGCILLGLGIDFKDRWPMMTGSKDGFNRFITMLANIRKFDLTIAQF